MLLSSWASRTDREESSTVAVTLVTISVPFTNTVTFRSEGKSTVNDASVSTSVDAGIRYPGNVVHVTVRNASLRGPHVVFPAPPSTSSSTPFDGTVNTVCTSADAENPLFRTLAWYTSTDPRVIRAGDDPRSVKNAARSACSTVLKGPTAGLSDRSASGRDCDTEAVSALVPKNCGIKFTVSSITCPAARGVTVVHVTVSTANVHVPVGHVYPTYVDGCGSSTVITMSVAVLGQVGHTRRHLRHGPGQHSRRDKRRNVDLGVLVDHLVRTRNVVGQIRVVTRRADRRHREHRRRVKPGSHLQRNRHKVRPRVARRFNPRNRARHVRFRRVRRARHRPRERPQRNRRRRQARLGNKPILDRHTRRIRRAQSTDNHVPQTGRPRHKRNARHKTRKRNHIHLRVGRNERSQDKRRVVVARINVVRKKRRVQRRNRRLHTRRRDTERNRNLLRRNSNPDLRNVARHHSRRRRQWRARQPRFRKPDAQRLEPSTAEINRRLDRRTRHTPVVGERRRDRRHTTPH